MGKKPKFVIVITFTDHRSSYKYEITETEFKRLSEDFNRHLENGASIKSGIYDVTALPHDEYDEPRPTKLMLRFSEVRSIG